MDLAGALRVHDEARALSAAVRVELVKIVEAEGAALATVARAIAPGLGWRHASPTLLGPSADAELTPEVRLHIGRAPLGWWAEARMSSVRGSSLKVHAKTDVRELLSALGAKLRAAAHAEERTADFKGAEGGIEGSKAERDAWRVALDVLQDRAVRP